jgi:hypothetical protein
MPKARAIDLLIRQKSQIPSLERIARGSTGFQKWRRDTSVTIGRVFGESSKQHREFDNISFSPGVIIMGGGVNQAEWDAAYRHGLEQASSMLGSFEDEIKEFWDDTEANPSPDALQTVVQLLSKFQVVARQLIHRHDSRPTLAITDEYDVQDLLHALLRVFFDDIREEESAPSVAGGTGRMDFLLKDHQIVVEVKKTRANLTAKVIGEQLMIDVERYRSHPDCKHLVCFVYDPENLIRNPAALEKDLSKETAGLNVVVLVFPK